MVSLRIILTSYVTLTEFVKVKAMTSVAKVWKSFDPNALKPAARYKLCISAVVPRPVAVITSVGTVDGKKVVNCAPFSYSGISAHDPPIVSHGLCLSNGKKKDTLRNIEENGEWVFNVLTKDFVEQANGCAAELPPELSEADAQNLTLLPCDNINVPRVEESSVAMECKLFDKKEIFNDDGKHTTTIVFGRVVKFHILDSVLVDGKEDDEPLVDLDKVQMVGRAGDITYWPVGVQPDGKLPMKRPS